MNDQQTLPPGAVQIDVQKVIQKLQQQHANASFELAKAEAIIETQAETIEALESALEAKDTILKANELAKAPNGATNGRTKKAKP
ncbi:MAG: hypothetical protein ACR2M4_06440 [Actinomycetota bacterium]